jgi:hypothetical protein
MDRGAAATLGHSIYGYNLKSSDDPFVLGVREATDNTIKAALPSSKLVMGGFQYFLTHVGFKTSW